METLLKNQEAKYNCPNCGGIISMHGPKMLRERARYLQLKKRKEQLAIAQSVSLMRMQTNRGLEVRRVFIYSRNEVYTFS
jgi:hypothetical protein